MMHDDGPEPPVSSPARLTWARPVPAHFTAQQRRFIAFVQHPGASRHGYLQATAGSGKTTTSTEAAWHLPLRPGERAAYFVYNRHNVAGVQERLPDHVPARTLHAQGLMLLARTRGEKLQIEKHRTARLMSMHFPVEDSGLSGEERRQALRLFVRLWDAARELDIGEDAHEDELADLAQLVEMDTAPQTLGLIAQLLSVMRQLSIEDWLEGGQPDFTDLLWLPTQLGLGRNSLAAAIVDEAQDLTPLRRRFVLHLLGVRVDGSGGGRLLLIADPEQCIFAFSGADTRGLEALARGLKMVRMPLSVSFRCPRGHVAAARMFSDFIEAAPGAREGVTEHARAETLSYSRGDVILCRLNAPLVREALRLMQQGVSVSIRGRDLAPQLRALIQEAFPGPFTMKTWSAPMLSLYERRTEALKARLRKDAGDRSARRALSDFRDQMSCVRLLAQQALEMKGDAPCSGADVLDLLRALYREDGDVLLSTVHRAKGLEWPRVTVLYPELMPLSAGDPEEERCVQFVALTRSTHTLRLAYGQAAWESGWRVEQLQAAEDGPCSAPLPCPSSSPADPQSLRPQARERADLAGASAGQTPETRERLLAYYRRLEEMQGAQHIGDDRTWPLYGGEDAVSVVTLHPRLETLARTKRPGLRGWAEASVVLMRGVQKREVLIHGERLREAERFARADERLRFSLMGQQGALLVARIIAGELCTIEGQLRRRGPRVVSTDVQGERLRFDARTGELLGATDFSGPYLLFP